MYSSCAADIHWINILTSNIFSHIIHISVCVFDRQYAHDNTGKTAAVDSADACTDLIQEKFCKCKA